MFDQPRSQSNNVVQLSADGSAGGLPPVILTRLPPIIHSLRDKSRQQLQGLIRELFDKVDDAMFELADKATNNYDQNIFFDSMRELRLGRKLMEANFFRNIDIRFAQLLDHNAYRNESPGINADSSDKEFSLDDLSLVKNDDLEEIVAVEAMINKANEQFAEQIQHLTLRIDHLVPVKVYQKNNPLGIDVLCHAFNESSSSLPIDVKAKLVLFKLFDNIVLANLGALLQTLNQLLIDANILPSLASSPRSKRQPITPATDYYGAGISAEYSPSPLAPGVTGASQPFANHPFSTQAFASNAGVGAPVYDEQTNHVLHALRDLLAGRGNGSGNGNSPAQSYAAQEIASQDLLRMLSVAQHQHGFGGGIAFANGAPALINVRELLQQLLANTAADQLPQQLNQVDDDVINLVSMMFDFILDDRNLAAPMKALIGRLQIPMVKVAIADKSFFSKGGHPARRLLNEMAMAALGWQEAGEDNQRKDSLYGKMESTVQTILSDFETDMAIFSDLLQDFREFLEKDKRRARILEQRTVDAEAGMAKSERARAQVDAVLARITAGHELPAAAQKLLLDAWGNVLFITALKFGADSDYWQGAVRTAQQLVWSLTAPMTTENRQGLLKLVPDLLQKLRNGLDDIAYSSYEAAQLFKQLEALHLMRLKATQSSANAQSSSDTQTTEPPLSKAGSFAAQVSAQTITAIATPEPETRLGGLPLAPVVDTSLEALETITLADPVGDSAVLADDAALLRAAMPRGALPESALTETASTENATAEISLPEGDQHLALVGNITQGSWFEMQSDDGQKFRCRLAAIIRSSGKYIFVNRSGMKVAEESRMTLALALKSGRLRVLDDGMLFDRALEAVISNLRANR